MERPLAIMFVDIADSTRLYEVVGNAKAAEVTRRVLFLLRGIIETHSGDVVKMLGDGLLAIFTVPGDAAKAALAMIAAEAGTTLKLRVGLNYGVVIRQTEDVYGDACNVAARVQSMARPGEVLATQQLADHLPPALRTQAKPLNRVSVKGKSDSFVLYELRASGADQSADVATVDATTVGYNIQTTGLPRRMTLHLVYQRRAYALDPQVPRLIVGRDESCGLRIASRQTSRHHAQIDFSRESFIVTDQSTNGTYIRVGTAPTVALRRDATKLVGQGLIGFGAEPLNENEDHVVVYRCDMG